MVPQRKSGLQIGVVNKTLLGFSIISLLIVLVTWVSWRMGDELNASFKKLVSQEIHTLEVGNYLIESVNGIATAISNYAATTDYQSLEIRELEYQKALNNYHLDIAELKNVKPPNAEAHGYYIKAIERQFKTVVAESERLRTAHRAFFKQTDLISQKTNDISILVSEILTKYSNNGNNRLLTSTIKLNKVVKNIIVARREETLTNLLNTIEQDINNRDFLDSSSEHQKLLDEIERNLIPMVQRKIDLQSEVQSSLNKITHEMNIGIVTNKMILSQSYKAVLDSATSAQQKFNAGVSVLAVLFLASIIISVSLTYSIPNAIRKPLNLFNRLLDALAKGNLNLKANYSKHDEFGKLAQHYDQTIDQLREIIQTASSNAGDISDASETNNRSSKDLANEVSIQSKEASSVAAAMTEMEHSFNEVAASASTTNSRVLDAKQTADQANLALHEHEKINEDLKQKLNEASELTSNVETVSHNIGGLVDVIRSISEQTNLLALNAAIEAARAGDQGRGFAVVADEVRGLAQRSGESTTEISEMINDLQGAVSHAVRNMTECLDVMDQSDRKNHDVNSAISEINSVIDDIVSMATHIATASEQQQLTASEIARNINGISESNRHIEEATQKLSNNGKMLNQLAEKQTAVVNQFTL